MECNALQYFNMCQRGQTLAVGEHYHVFNRGAHKQLIFKSDEDHRRFLVLLLLANSTCPLDIRGTLQKYNGHVCTDTFNEKSDKSLVDILAYTLMPNHFHLVLRQKTEGGICAFMRKVCTAYSMYFNAKYKHGGVLFQGRYQSKHINNDSYFRYIFSYVHLNPLELLEPHWKNSTPRNSKRLQMLLSSYPYSSYVDYCVQSRPEQNILSIVDIPEFLRMNNDISDFLSWNNSDTYDAESDAKDRPLSATE